MTTSPLNLGELMTELEAATDRTLVFRYRGIDIGAGYHLTEFKRAAIESIDCGANRHAWTEARMQLLDGRGPKHMPVSTFMGIATKSMAALGDLSGLPLIVEFAPRNEGLNQVAVTSVHHEDGRIVVNLADDRAKCKPAAAWLPPRTGAADAATSCCGSAKQSAAACRGSTASEAAACCG